MMKLLLNAIRAIALSTFSANGEISSARVGFYISLIGVIAMTWVDMYLNKSLNATMAIAILTAGTGGYATTKMAETISGSKPPEPQSKEEQC